MFEEDRFATPTDACREYARNVGSDRPDRPWILTNYDTWERNPYYRGPACFAVMDPDDPGEEFLDAHAGCSGADKCLLGWTRETPPWTPAPGVGLLGFNLREVGNKAAFDKRKVDVRVPF